MESNEYLQKVLEKIELDTSENQTVKSLSDECYVSSRQLYRDFYSLTGHSVNEYVRKRRLSKALSLLKYSEMNITDIALLCGYSSGQAFSRSLAKSLGMTPTQYRNSRDIFYFPFFDGNFTRKIVVKSETIPSMLCLKYYCSSLSGIENKAINEFISVLPDYNGRLFGKNGCQIGRHFCYELYMEYREEYISKLKNTVFSQYKLTDGYKAFFACTVCKNDEKDINAAWDFLYNHWLKNSMFRQDSVSYFEEYILKKQKVKKLILHLPVISGENFNKIKIEFFENRQFIIASKKGTDAEKKASELVVDFIDRHYPYLLKTQNEFYIAEKDCRYTCGININDETKITDDGDVSILSVPKGYFAVLEGACYGSAAEYEHVLLSWINDNGFKALGHSFSIYDTSKGASENEITVKAQVRINLAEYDTTNDKHHDII